MRILVLLPDSPAPWSSTAARYYGPMLKTLDALGHRVTALVVRRSAQTKTEVASYFGNCGISFRYFDQPHPRPLLERKARSLWRSGWELSVSEFGRAARQEAAGDYDLILAEQISTARAVEGVPRVVCTLHCFRHVDMDAVAPQRRWIRRLRRLQVRREERSTIAGVGRIRALSRRLEILTHSLVPSAKTCVIPLCIDPALYDPVNLPITPTVGVIGSMFWEPSRAAAIQFITEIAPGVRRRAPDAQFLVAGWNARRYLGSLARRAGVELIEDFPHPREVFQRLSVLVYAPPVGTGMKVKVLESMAYGVPAVVNDEGFEGLEVDPNPAVRLSNTTDEIVESVTELLRNPDARRRAAQGGRESVMTFFSPERVARQMAIQLPAMVASCDSPPA